MELVKKVTNPTKLIYSDYLSEASGAKVYYKPENMQHTGAYKIRGAYYKISTLTEGREGKRADHRIGGKSCPGSRIRGKTVRMQGCDRHADSYSSDQGKPDKELWR